jgi:hypothetical protein
MKRLFRVLEIMFLLVVIAIYCKPAHAYVDMGTGSYILQVSIAAAAGLLFSVKLFWSTLRERALGVLSHLHHEKTVPQTEKNAK